MDSMLSAEAAVLVHLQTVGIVLFVFHRVVIPLLALCAGERYSNAHSGTSSKNLRTPGTGKAQKPQSRTMPVRLPEEAGINGLYCLPLQQFRRGAERG